MDAHTTPAPGIPSAVSEPPFTKAVTEVGVNDISETGDLAELIGGIVGTVLLVLICIIIVLLWCMTRQKGSYVTNETDDDDEVDDDNDNQSVGSDAELQSKEPLKTKEDE